jgi:hypothetical protein
MPAISITRQNAIPDLSRALTLTWTESFWNFETLHATLIEQRSHLLNADEIKKSVLGA